MTRRSLARAVTALVAPGFFCAACATSSAPRSAIDPRYEAVHNALAGAGMAEVGAIVRGSIGKGAEVRMPIDLRPPCTTIVVLGADGSGDLDATVVDAAGRVIARDATVDAEPVVKACVAERGPYTLIVKSSGASGDFLVSQYTTEGVVPASLTPKNDGTCNAPFPIAEGHLSGNTKHTPSDLEGSCGNSSGHELVYRFELKERRSVIVDVDPKFDAVLYIRKDSCTDTDSEVACNDDSGQGNRSHLEETLDPGVYFFVVDGGSEGGAFTIDVSTKVAEPLSRACDRAPSLVFGTTVHDSWDGATDHLSGACSGEQHGADQIYKLTVPAPSAARVRISEQSSDAQPVLVVRSSCQDDADDLSCSNIGEGDLSTTATTSSILGPGDYFVVADSQSVRPGGSYQGAFTLDAEFDDEHGEGVAGDTCGDAIPIRETGEIRGDTFHAVDDSATRCGGRGAPDIVYRIEAAHRTRLLASFTRDEARHVLSLSRTCGGHSSVSTNVQACGGAIATTLTPGSWFLTVDGTARDQFGRYALAVDMHDARPQEAACKAARTVRLGSKIEGDTSNAPDAFTNGCASPFAGVTGLLGPLGTPTGSGDRVYRFDLKERALVTASVETSGWPAQVALRKSCEDGGSDVEIVCNASNGTDPANAESYLEPGTYFVVVDGEGGGNGGKFQLSLATRTDSPSIEE